MDRPIRVLVLEDDLAFRDVLEELLQDRGYEVVAAGRGEEAVQLARNEPFDLIVADIRMEGMSGLDAIEQARELHPELGAIVISGYASEEETLRAVRLKVGGYLKKPFKMQDLLDRINEFVTRRAVELRQASELERARRALAWSFEGLGHLGEQLHAGRVLRAADLAEGIGRQLGLGGDMPQQLRWAAILHQLDHLMALKMPERVVDGLHVLPGLRASMQKSEDAAAFAAQLCRRLEPQEGLPSAEALELEQPLREAYHRLVTEGEAGPVEQQARAGLVRLGRALEQAGDFAGATLAYEEAADGAGGEAIQALLGLARLAVAQGQREGLEESIKSVLARAEQLGPVAQAMAELEATDILTRAGHPVANKLLARAIESLAAVKLHVPRASAVVRLANRAEVSAEAVEQALAVLADPNFLLEVFEQMAVVLPELLEYAARTEHMPAAKLAARFVRDYPQEATRALRGGRLTAAARGLVLTSLEGHQDAPADLVEVLGDDPDPELRARALRLASGSAAPPIVRVYSLGPIELFLGEHRVDEKAWKSQKIKYLFWFLAAHNQPVVVDAIMEEFWPGPLENARHNLNTSVSSVRRCLKGDSDGGLDPVLREKDTLALNPELPLWHDLDELEKAHQQALACLEAGKTEQAMAHFSRVARLYRGPYLEGCYMDWAVARRTSVEHLAADALERLIASRLEVGRHREALEYSIRLLEVRPDNQEAHHFKMLAHLGLGEPEQAIKQFEACQKMLANLYDMEPTTELLRTYHRARYGLSDSPSWIG